MKKRGKIRTKVVNKDHSIAKVSAFIFIIAGIFFMGFAGSGSGATGNVIDSASSSGSSFSLEFFLPLGLMVIGAVLLFKTMVSKQ
ncbi:MAG TPA: hypothetical protein VJH92_03515 [Candidatus Nanoarchaeia archaeon]|nr:hypothetical protein [Candidatus Nanoarchaeia archaeon]